MSLNIHPDQPTARKRTNSRRTLVSHGWMNEEHEWIQTSHPKMGPLDRLQQRKFLQKRSCFTSLHWCHTQPLKQTIWTINQCGVFFLIKQYTIKKVLQISLWIKKNKFDVNKVWCQSSVEAIGMAVWAVKLKTLKKTVCQQKNKPFRGKNQQWSLKCIPGCEPNPTHPSFPCLPLHFPPHADPLK